jgi:hypothetical protein
VDEWNGMGWVGGWIGDGDLMEVFKVVLVVEAVAVVTVVAVVCCCCCLLFVVVVIVCVCGGGGVTWSDASSSGLTRLHQLSPLRHASEKTPAGS